MRSTVVVGVNTSLSRVLGLVRDVVIAATFGAGAGADAFFVAFRIPNFLRRLFAEGAFSQAFVPVLTEYKSRRPHDEVRELAAHVAGALGGVLFVVTLAGVVAAPLLVLAFAPGFIGDAEKAELTARMLRLTFPYLLFISLTSLAAGLLNAHGRFGVAAFTPVLLNLSLIAAAVWLAPLLAEPVVALAWGVLIAGLAQLLFQLPFLGRLGLLAWPRYRRGHAGVSRILKLILPAIFGVSVSQINLLVDTLIASFLVTGSISWLYYSDRLMEFPLGVFGIALATVLLPRLSEQHATGSTAAFTGTIDWALRWVLLVALPAAAGLVILAGPLLATIFQHGAFDARGVRMATLSLMAYAAGLPGFVCIKVLAPGFFARQDMRTPVRIGVVAMLANIGLNLALVIPLAHAGLALATSLSAFLNAYLLYRGLRACGVYRPAAGWAGYASRVCIAVALMTAFLWWARGDLSAWMQWGLAERAGRVAMLVAGGAALYFAFLRLLGLRLRQLLLRGGA